MKERKPSPDDFSLISMSLRWPLPWYQLVFVILSMAPRGDGFSRSATLVAQGAFVGALLSLVALALSLAPALDFVRPLALRLAADFYVTDLAVGVPVLLTSTPAATNAHPG